MQLEVEHGAGPQPLAGAFGEGVVHPPGRPALETFRLVRRRLAFLGILDPHDDMVGGFQIPWPDDGGAHPHHVGERRRHIHVAIIHHAGGRDVLRLRQGDDVIGFARLPVDHGHGDVLQRVGALAAGSPLLNPAQ